MPGGALAASSWSVLQIGQTCWTSPFFARVMQWAWPYARHCHHLSTPCMHASRPGEGGLRNLADIPGTSVAGRLDTLVYVGPAETQQEKESVLRALTRRDSSKPARRI